MIPTETEIDYFIHLYQNLHLSKTAVQLGITQPTLSQSLQKLEAKVGTKLFIRTKQGLVATRASKLFFTQCKNLMEQWHGIQASLTNQKQDLVGKFKVGCHPSVGAFTVTKFLNALNAHAPSIEIELVHDLSRVITEKVISHEIDFAYVVNPFKHPDLVMVKLGIDQVRFWKKRGLTTVPKKLIADLSLHQVNSMLSKTHKNFFNEWTMIQTSSLELIRTLTLNGNGIGILPERVALADGADLVPYDSKLPVFEDEIFLIYRKEAINSLVEKTLIKLAKISL